MRSGLRVCLLLGWLAVPLSAGFAQWMPSAIQSLPGAARTRLGSAPAQPAAPAKSPNVQTDAVQVMRPAMRPKPLPAALTEPGAAETPVAEPADSGASLGEMARKLRAQKQKQAAPSADSVTSSPAAPHKPAPNESTPASGKPFPKP